MAETNITWDGTRINEIERDALHLESINRNGTVSEMIDTINANFLEIAKHGGGPAGMDGSSGLNGEDGVNVEYIYALCDMMEPNTHYPTDDNSKYNLFKRVKNSGSADHNGVTWYDHAQPISKEHKNEYVFSRFRRNVDTEEDTVTSWIYDSKPVLWAHWGETGQDGDGVEYIFMVSNDEITDPNALDRLIMKKSAMDEYQKAIFNIDDFYPGADWFAIPNNRSKVQNVFQNLGLEMSDSTFSSRWGDKFGFTAYGEWTDEPTGVGPDKQYEYVSIRRSVTDENDKKVWGDYSRPALWSNYTFEGRIFIIYCNTLKDATPVAPQKGQGRWINTDGQDYLDMTGIPEGWTDNHRNKEDNEITWMSSGIFDHSGQNLSWSNPVCISGKDGKDGEDGTNIQFIYALSPSPNYPRTYSEKEELFNAVENDTAHNPKYSEWGTTRWYDRAQPISQHDPTEYMWARRREKESDPWEYDPEPIIWAHWGEDGTDGDGVEYIFAVTEVEDPRGLVLPKIANLDESQRKIFQIDDFVPSREWFSKPRSKEKSMEALGETFEEGRWTNYYGFDLTSGWKDDPIPVDHYSPYQWVSIRRSTADEISGKRVWEDFSDPVLWNSYGKSTRVFIIYCNMPADEEHPDREKPNKPVDGTGTWVISGNDSYLDLTDVVDALTGVTPSQRNLKIGIWDDKNIDVLGTISWMCSGVFTDDGKNISWSQPFRISGEKGEPGEDGDNIEFIYALSTGMPAHPVSGVSMTDEEYDFICSFFYNIDNAKKANLSNPDDPVNEGLDLANIHIDENGIAYYEYTDANGTTAWYDSPQGIDDVPGKRTEWVWQRSKAYDETRWSFTPEPVIWSHWGEDGTDGDGVEYVFHLSQHNDDVFPTNELPPEKPESTSSNRDICKKAIYNLKDFYPDARWFTADTNGDGVVDGRQAAKEAIVDGGLLSETEFNDLWNAEVSNLTYFGLDKDWTDDPQETTYDKPFQFVSIRKSYTNPTTEKKEWGPYSTPKLWSRYLIQTRVFMVYCNVDEGKTPTPPSLDYGWWAGDDRLKAGENDSRPYEAPAYDKDNPSTQIGVWIDSDVYQENKIAWICSMTFAENGIAVSSSEPFRITGYRGRPGADGSTIEFVYALCDVEADLKYPDPNSSTYEQLMAFFDAVEAASSNPETPYYDYNGIHWYDNPQGVSDEDGRKKEWVWSRNKTAGDSSTLWTVPPKPVIWSHWGEDGTDGDGVEYIFCLGSSSTFGVSEEQWNSYFDIFNNNATSKAVYSMDDFVPNIIWFANGENMTAVQQKMHDEELGIFNETDYNNLDDYLNAAIPWGTLGNWLDNPTDVTASYQYQFVSIRKSENGVWGKFSYPKLWGNYSTAQFTTFAFTATETNIELDKLVEGGTLTLSGGTYDNPYPNDITVNGNTYHWTDGPDPDAARGKIIIWMTTAHVNEGENITNWSVPQKMVDQKGFQVEWCSVEDITPAVRQRFESDAFNFEVFLKMNGYDENTSEEAWRNAVKNGYITADSQTVEGLGLQFGDDAENAIYMATCQIKGGVWTNWKLTKVKGEQGEVGPEGRSINVKGFVRYEYYLDEGVTYSVDTATEKFNSVKSSIVPTPNEGDLAIVYPHDMAENDVYYGVDDLGGALCVWKYVSGSWIPYYTDEHIGTDENIGDTYTSPNHHLILWDGDSWQDVGNLVGPTGPAGEILVKYAMDNTDVVVAEGEPLPKRFAEDDEIPFAKYIGFITYPEGQRPAWSFDPNGVGPNGETWNWSLFKGQDGYGYEFIYRGTDTYNTDILLPPNGPNWDVTPNIVPDYWTDEPIEPSLPDAKYVWMGWRKYDFKTQKWTPFYGNKSSSTPKKPVLWAVFMSTITEVHEYYHVDSNISPSDLDTHFGDDGNTIDTEYWVDKETALANWNSENKYLFNVETITYTGDRVEVLDPHLVSVYADGIVDVVDYYCLCDNGSNAPAMNGLIPYTVDTLPVEGVEGINYWTTDASKTIPNADNRFLWNVSYKIFEDTEKNHWSTPLVAGIYGQGENGADAIYADLDNEMDVVRAKRLEDGTVEVFPNVNNVFTTTVRMYKGSQAMKIKSCSISGEELEGLEGAIEFYINGDENTPYIDGSDISGGANSITMKLSVNSNPGNDAFLLLQSEYINIVFTVVGLDPTEPVRMATYKLTTTTSPVTYKIVPSDNAILIGRVDNQRKPASLTIDVIENNGENGQVYNGYSITNPFKLWLSINDDDPTEFTSPTFSIDTNGTYTIDGESRKLASGDKLTLMLDADFIGEDGEFETRVDTETIYVLKEVKDGNGYEYCYFRYDTNVSYGSSTVVTVAQDTPEDDPVFKIGNKDVTSTSTSEPMGADSSHPFEYRSQRSGYDTTWSKWSQPVTVAKYFDSDNIEGTVQAIVDNAKNDILSTTESNISSALSTYEYLKGFISSDGTYSGQFADKLSSGMATIVSNTDLTGQVTSTLNGIISNETSTTTFSNWINDTTGSINSVQSTLTSHNNSIASLQNSVTSLNGETDELSSAISTLSTNTEEHFASIDSAVANMEYLKDDAGYLLVDDNGTRRRALKSNGQPAQNYSDVRTSDRSKLIKIVNEIASISESVGDGVSVVSILAAVDDDEDNQIAAAIFAEANESTGSSITLNADKINLSSSHKLSLSSGTFTINSDNFKIDEFGQVTAKGSIMADKFESISNVAYPTDPTLTTSDYVGSLNKSTFVDSSQFNISATGTLSKRTGSGTKEITNSLYITLVDEVVNENDDIKENGTTVDKLYAVPTLCMMYNGTPYILNPSIWKSLFSSAQSNMRFIPKYNILRFNIGTLPTSTTNNISNKYFYGSTSATGKGSSKTFKYYITRPDNGDVTGYITNKKSDTLYRIKVLSWGSNKSTEYGYMVSKSIKSSSTDEKTDCAYSTFDRLDTVKYTNPGSGERGTSYINTGSTTEITQDNCTIFQYFKSGGFSFGVNDSSCIYSKSFNSYDDPVDSEYGADKLFNLAITLLKGDTSMMYSAGLWGATSDTISDGEYSKSSWDGAMIENLDNYIPFDTSININHDSSGWDDGQFEISIYPVCTISSDALTCTKVIEKVFVNVHVFMIHHGSENSNMTILREGSTTLPFTLNIFKIDMNFDLILQFSSSFNNYDPDDSTTYENVISYVKAFLESNNFPYSSLTSNSYKSYYYKWLNINAHVYGNHSVHAWNRNNSNGSNDPYSG